MLVLIVSEMILYFHSFLLASEEKEESTPRKKDAQKQEELIKEVVVTATRSEKDIFELPYTVESIDFDYLIHRKQARTLPESLSEIPSIMVQKTSHGQGSPFIRGFTGFRNVLLIDGIRLNHSAFREGPNQYWTTVDPLMLDKIEIVEGSSSVLYGSDAIGGTVNVITRERLDYTKDIGFNGRSYYRFATAENSHIWRQEFSGNFGSKFGFLIGGALKNYGDISTPDGKLPHTGYEQQNIDFKANYFIKPNSKMTFAYQYDNIDDAWRTHRTIYSKSYRGTTIGEDLELSYDHNRQLAYLQYQIDDANSFFDEAKFSLSFHSQEETEFRMRTSGRRVQGFSVDTLGLFGQFITSTKIGKLTYGTEYYLDFVDSFRRDPDNPDPTLQVSPRGPIADAAKYHLFGVYLQNEVEMSRDLELITGARYSWIKATAQQVGTGNIEPNFATLPDLNKIYSSLVGNARLLYRWNKNWNIYTGVAQGFRAPNLSDLTRFDTSRSGEIETPSTSLAPEKYITFETGIKSKYESFQSSINYFYTVIDGMIIRTPTGVLIDGEPEVTKSNVGDGFVHGVETKFAFNLKDIGLTQWTSTMFINWIDGEVDTFPTSEPIKQRKPISRLQPASATLGLKWEDSFNNYWIEGLIKVVDKQNKLSPGDIRDTQRIPPDGTPGYTTLLVRSGIPINTNTQFFIAIENITDKNYRIHGSGQNEPGRNFILALELNF